MISPRNIILGGTRTRFNPGKDSIKPIIVTLLPKDQTRENINIPAGRSIFHFLVDSERTTRKIIPIPG